MTTYTKALGAFAFGALAVLLLASLAGLRLETYGAPGSPNGGIVVTTGATCQGAGLELWGHPGPFAQFDC